MKGAQICIYMYCISTFFITQYLDQNFLSQGKCRILRQELSCHEVIVRSRRSRKRGYVPKYWRESDKRCRGSGRGGTKVDYLIILIDLFDQYTMMKRFLLFYSPEHYHKISSEVSLNS